LFYLRSEDDESDEQTEDDEVDEQTRADQEELELLERELKTSAEEEERIKRKT
jgi:hypothetical protein